MENNFDMSFRRTNNSHTPTPQVHFIGKVLSSSLSIELYCICNWGRTRGYAKSSSSSFAGRLRLLAAPSRYHHGGLVPQRIGAGLGALPRACKWPYAGSRWGSSSPPTTELTVSPEGWQDYLRRACVPEGQTLVELVAERPLVRA